MGNKVLRSLTYQNLKAHRKAGIAFILSSSVFMSLLYIVFSLINNQYVQTRHETLPSIMKFAAFLLIIFSAIFMIYASNFIMKQRYKEIGLYSVLGLEKKHIRKVIRLEAVLEYSIIAVVSIPGGYLFGNLCFMLVNKLMKDTATVFMEYPFDAFSAAATLAVLLLIMLLTYIISALKINLSNPLNLMKSSYKGEKEPKANIIIMILGLVCLIWGYYIAFTTEGALDSILSIFQAIILVIIGTYFLFASLSIFTLKSLKKNKKYYYKAENFLTVSGMLYRMKANSASLASLAVLLTGIMMVLGMTFTSYLSMEDIVNSSFESDYQISYSGDEEVLNRVVEDMRGIIDVKEVATYKDITIVFELSEGKIVELTENGSVKNAGMATVMTVEDYNSAYGEKLKLNDNQLGFSSNAGRWDNFDEINFMADDYKIVKLNKKPSSKIALDYVILVIPGKLNYEEITNTFLDVTDGENSHSQIKNNANINAEGDLKSAEDKIDEIAAKNNVLIGSKEGVRTFIYQMNGGLLFLGILVGIILLVGTFLMIYFKQMSEGYEDVGNYTIMKQVGLDDKLIKKTIKSQIKWVFILPVLVATVHGLASSKIIFNALGVIGVRDYKLFITNYLMVIAVFAIAYGIMYRITSKLYYNIINRKEFS